jgi:dTDP-4-amino-4,6-dideoxygalactose transaminase/CelD/BcsL family acetyltransferase involved in cellulose biosynthesis
MRLGAGRLDVWPPLPPAYQFRRRADALQFPLAEPGVTIFARARHGLFLGVRALRLLPGDEILAPAYHHGSEIEALIQAGLEPRFYEATETLEPDEAELEQLLTSKSRALYLIHYLGFPQDAARWRRFCDEHRLLLIEDAAQAWLASGNGRPVGSDGDLAIFCLYKTVGLPDGAALVVRGGEVASSAPGRPRLGIAALSRGYGLWIVGRSRLASLAATALERGGEYSAEDDFRLGTPEPPGLAALSLGSRVPLDVAARRRAHYRLLLEELRGDVPRPFECLPPGSSPFAFPVATPRKSHLLERLACAGVRAVDLWSVPHPSLPEEQFPEAAKRRGTTVCLPVHQELRLVDVERVARAARHHPATPGYRLEWLADLDLARDDWRRLARASCNVFATWEWASLWWRRYGRGNPLIVRVRRREEECFALLPLYVWREGPLRVLRFLGHGTADELGPVCAPSDRAAAAGALRQVLAHAKCDLLLADHLPAEDSWSSLLGGAVVQREGYPLIRGARSWEGYLASRSGHFRKKMLWQERRLAREHELRYRLSEDPACLRSDLETLFALHAARWPEGTGFLQYEKFHRDFAACALEAGWLRLWFLELDGRAVAAWYGFRFGEIEFYLQSGRDSALRDSAGSVLLAHTVREALNDGVREYRFLRGAEAYKRRFATDDPGLETVAVGCSRLGRAALAAARLAGSIDPVRSAITWRARQARGHVSPQRDRTSTRPNR